MPADARNFAWLRAWELLEAVRNTHAQMRPDMANETRQHCEQLMAEAEIHARLACAPSEVGEAVGEYLRQEESRKAEDKQRMEEALKHLGR